MDICILVDPALDGLSGIVVTGCDRRKRIFILEAIKGSYPPHSLRDLIFRLVGKWKPRVVVFEEVLFSKLYEPWFQAEQKLRGVKFTIELQKTKQQEKSLRVEGLTHYFETGQIYFHRDQTELIEEFDHFGATEDYHMLDALAYGPRVWRYGNTSRGSSNIGIQETLDAQRNPRTGYSRI